MFIYYAGHGVSDNYSYALLNENTKSPFALEKHVRSISKEVGSYVIALFDCCREKVKDLPQSVARGKTSHENFIITFGCPPSDTVAARSTIARAYFMFLCDARDKKGYIGLPGNLNYWNGDDGKAEHSLKVPSGPILL